MLKEVAREFADSISRYCRARVNAGKCDDGECEFCAVNEAYALAEVDSGMLQKITEEE